MKLGGERLTMIVKLVEQPVLKYWKDLPIPESTVAYQHILKMDKRSFPRFKALPESWGLG